MAKRFTDPNKWHDEWFMELKPEFKLLWIYLTDVCDHAGIWRVNKRLAEFNIGHIDWSQAKEALVDRVYFGNDQYWFVPKFLSFHYGRDLKYGNAIKSAVKLIEDKGFSQIAVKVLGSPYLRVRKGLGKGYPTLQSKSISKSCSSSKTFSFEEVWKEYPRRLGKKEALRHFRATVTTEHQFASLKLALRKYKANVVGKSPEYIQHGSTWFNNWQDWVEFDEPKSVLSSALKPYQDPAKDIKPEDLPTAEDLRQAKEEAGLVRPA